LGDLAVVQGAGPIGLLTLQWVRSGGARRIIVVEPDEGRAELARRLGADTVVAPGEEATATVLEASHGVGADLVYECVGRTDTVQVAVDLARRGGAMSLIGLAEGEAPINPSSWLTKEITVQGALAYTHEEFAMAMGMIADGRVDVDALHTRTVSLDAFDTVLAELAEGGTGETKVLVDPR
jgi:(R,R)-butanediol dehydrogenase/meso-butanediol dehydrogenase/diacetyl reductase